jgi:nitrate/nitrite transport system ATP-binding protein
VNKRYLEIQELGKNFPSAQGVLEIVKGFNLTVQEGEFVSIVGHSGCGKSTVLSMVAGLTQASEGVMILAGKELRGAGPDRGMVFQAPCLLSWLSALGNVLLGVDQVHASKSVAERRNLATHYLELVGLGDALAQRPAELSAGMRQRVSLARAFALDPRMLLLDEPFGMLDALTRLELQDILLDLWSQNRKTALMVTHDVDEAIFLSDRVVLMTSGPAARVGEVVAVPFERPRRRAELLDSDEFAALRGRIVDVLENQGHQPPAAARTASASVAETIAPSSPWIAPSLVPAAVRRTVARRAAMLRSG